MLRQHQNPLISNPPSCYFHLYTHGLTYSNPHSDTLEGILRNLCDYCNFVPREECPSPIFDPVGCESPADTHNNLDSMQTVFFPVQITITECTEIDEKVCMFC